MFEILSAGGWLMLPIILASIAVVAISIERYWTLNAKKMAPRHLLAQVWGWIKNNQIDANRLSELKQSSALGRILAAGLSNSRDGREFMKDSIQQPISNIRNLQILTDKEKRGQEEVVFNIFSFLPILNLKLNFNAIMSHENLE